MAHSLHPLARDANSEQDNDATSTIPARFIVTIVGTALVGTLTAPAAFADDPLAQIINTMKKDREKACHDTTGFAAFTSNKDLEAIAQAYARSETPPTSPPPAGFLSVISFLGSGNPEAQAINRAYQHGAGQAIGNCTYTGGALVQAYGVGFVRHADRNVDVVTIVFGVNNPAPFNPNPGTIK